MKRTVLLFIFLLAGCNGNEPTPTQTAVSQLTSTPTIAPTIQPTDQPTTQPPDTATAVSTAIPTDTPTAQPTNPPTIQPSNTPTIQPTDTPTPVPAVVEIPGAIVPDGFSMVKFADMYRPTGLAFDGNGRLFATSFDGTVHLFTDDDGDGKADSDTIFASGFETPLGVVARTNPTAILISSTGKITQLRDLDGNGVADSRSDFVTGLPTGLHQNNNLKFGPDGMLYMGVGSTCDVCIEPDERSATIMRFDPLNGEGEIVATGLRNPYDFAFHPATGALFATENGRDDLGVNNPPEELNHIIEGADYGWPDCWGEAQGENCEGMQQAVGFFAARASANSLVFYEGDTFPSGYQNAAFVTLFGSFETVVQTGILVMGIAPSGDSYDVTMNWFATWPNARPLGLTVGPDGALYVGDYLQDVIYRISYGN